ncbi:MAG: porin family protein [Steroidobacteraceae bacterium]
MNSKIISLSLGAVVLGTVVTSSAMAQGYYGPDYDRGGNDFRPYIGASVGELIYSEPGLETLYPSAFNFRLGVPLSRYLAIEGRVGTGFSDTRTYVDGDPVDVGIDSMYAGYLKGSLPLAPQFSLYGLAGAAHTNLEVKSDGQSSHFQESSFSFGVGGDYWLNRDMALNVEWVRTMRDGFDDDGYTGDLLTVGLNWQL